MPEGHTLHRLARDLRSDLGGQAVRAWSPQGRFSEGAARLDGQVLRDVQAAGKHLFAHFAGGEVLHVHLGLFGRLLRFAGDAPPPTPSTRLALVAGDRTAYLAGPTACDLVTPDEEAAIRARLGPDPLARRADPERFRAALRRRSIPIGAALLDQKAIAGIGNVFRAEALFACGIWPDRPADGLTDDEVDRLWSTLQAMLRQGVRLNRIVTVDPASVGARGPAGVPDDQRVHVYRRGGQPCRRCGTVLRAWALAGRTITACPRCQPPPVDATEPG